MHISVSGHEPLLYKKIQNCYIFFSHTKHKRLLEYWREIDTSKYSRLHDVLCEKGLGGLAYVW